MKRGQRFATLLLLDREMFQQGSWCGETHLQKGTFFIQELLDTDLEYEFILYKHGPFSFELRDDLLEMQADGLLQLVATHPGYGPSYLPTSDAEQFLERFPKTAGNLSSSARFVAELLGSRGVAELERVATALFIRKRGTPATSNYRAAELVRLKPHIAFPDAVAATEEVDRLIERTEHRLS